MIAQISKLLLAGLFAFSPFAAAPAATPPTPKKPVTDEYQGGVKVEDNYQWLEKDDDPEVKAWSDAQNQQTRAYLDKLPDRAALAKQLADWYAKTSPSYSALTSRPGLLFALKFQPPKQQPMFFSGSSGGAPATVKHKEAKVGRNDPCPCGSGKKYKRCHGAAA